MSHVIRKLESNIWVAETEFRFAGADFGNRMTLIRLPSGKLLLHSPIEFNELLAREIDLIGDVGFIITPNNFHGLFVERWCAKYPDARYYSTKENNIPGGHSLSQLSNEDLESSVEIVAIEGISKLNEFVFFHSESATLILTDLAFNFDCNVSLWSKIFYRLNGCYDKFGPSRLMKSMIDDPDELMLSLDKMNKCNFTRIIVSHGKIVEENAKLIFEKAFSREEAGLVKTKAKIKLSFSKCG